MSKLFFDHLIVLTEMEAHIKKSAATEEEKHELWEIVDEMVHHKVFDVILTHLHNRHHSEFLEKFHMSPHDDSLLDFISLKSKKDMAKIIKEELKNLEKEIVMSLRTK